MSVASRLGLKLPVICAPMFLVTGPELVIAACKAGIGGAIPTPNARTIAELDAWFGEITSALSPGDGRWIANVITHSSNPRLAEDLRLIAEYKPPIVITALGSPKPAVETVKGYGGLLFADVASLSLGRKAAAAGIDGLACLCAGAGGHTGHLSPFAFVSAVREFFDGVIAVSGGIADGAGVAGALAAGADLVYMGTRFLPTVESRARAAYKQMVIDCDADDLIVSAAISGAPASWLKPSLRAAGYDPDKLGGTAPPISAGEGAKRWLDLWAAGQGLGRSRAIEPVAEVVKTLSDEYRAALARLARIALD